MLIVPLIITIIVDTLLVDLLDPLHRSRVLVMWIMILSNRNLLDPLHHHIKRSQDVM